MNKIFEGKRILVTGGAGFLGSFRGQAAPSFQILTMNPDSSVMQGQPLGSAPGGPGDQALAIPVLDRLGLLLLLLVVRKALLCHGRYWLSLFTFAPE